MDDEKKTIYCTVEAPTIIDQGFEHWSNKELTNQDGIGTSQKDNPHN